MKDETGCTPIHRITASLPFHRSFRVGTPLLPASHEHLHLGIARQFQGECLDRGPSPGLSVAYGGLVGLDPSLLEQFPQLFWGLEPAVIGQQFLPFEMLGTGNMPTPFASNFLARELV